jgi:hypothetical protein
MSSTLEDKNTLPPDAGRDPGEKHYRILVKSPEEALKVIRKKFGDKAKVLSVKQVEGEGLAKFLSQARNYPYCCQWGSYDPRNSENSKPGRSEC